MIYFIVLIHSKRVSVIIAPYYGKNQRTVNIVRYVYELNKSRKSLKRALIILREGEHPLNLHFSFSLQQFYSKMYENLYFYCC